MAVSKAATASIGTFARYNDAVAGNAGGGGSSEFILTQNAATAAYSANGTTWTTFTPFSYTGNPDKISYNPTTQMWIYMDSGYVYGGKSRSSGFKYLHSLQGVRISNPVNNQVVFKVLGPNEYWGSGSTGDNWLTVCGRSSGGFMTSNTSFSNKQSSSIAWNGANIWAVGATNNAYYYQTTTDTSQYPTGTLDFTSPWISFSGPAGLTTQFRDITFFNNAWHVAATTGVWRTPTLSASPTWTQTSTVGTVLLPTANNVMWNMQTNWASVSTIYSTTDGTTWNTITLPSSKVRKTIVYGNGIYVIANGDGTVTTSTTGASGSWTDRSTGLSGSATSIVNLAFGPA